MYVETSTEVSRGTALLRAHTGEVFISTDGHWKMLRNLLANQTFPLLQLVATSSRT